jgi:hypothetical protein
VAKETFVLHNGTVPAGYGDSGDSIDARAYTSGVFYFKATDQPAGNLTFGLFEVDETSDSYTSVAGSTFSAPGGFFRTALALPGTAYQVEWFSPGAGATITASLVLDDQ